MQLERKVADHYCFNSATSCRLRIAAADTPIPDSVKNPSENPIPYHESFLIGFLSLGNCSITLNDGAFIEFFN